VDLALPDLLAEPVLRDDDFTDLPAVDCLTVEETDFPVLLEVVLLAGVETFLAAFELLLVTVVACLLFTLLRVGVVACLLFTLLRVGVVACLLFTLLRAGVVTCLLLLLVTLLVCLVATLLPADDLLPLTTLLFTGVVTP
jgi:hypothetical protein